MPTHRADAETARAGTTTAVITSLHRWCASPRLRWLCRRGGRGLDEGRPLAMSVTQTLPEGINYTVAWGGSKSTSNSTFNNYNPALASNLSITVSQPLIQNRGAYVNRLMLMTARSRLKISEYGLKVQLLTLVSAAESAYWDVVAARESLK